MSRTRRPGDSVSELRAAALTCARAASEIEMYRRTMLGTLLASSAQREDAIDEVRQAVRVEGSHPDHHRQVMRRHRQEWPTLWAAIDALIGPS